MPSSKQHVAIIGSGASCLYLLQSLWQNVSVLKTRLERVSVYERSDRAGVGMPYHPATTDRYHICNISSEELPKLDQSFADWLRQLSDEKLDLFDHRRDSITEQETYERLLLGEYLQAMFNEVVSDLNGAGIEVEVRCNTPVDDIEDLPEKSAVKIVCGDAMAVVDRVVIATGHTLAEDDRPEFGHFRSPWPIQKLLPADGETFNFPVGVLGSSLSAFDVITSLAHRHGEFLPSEDGGLRFVPASTAPDFRIVMHSLKGWLPHLQYEQAEPYRSVYRHASQRQIRDLRDDRGFLRLEDYFDQVCRPALSDAFENDGRPEIASLLRDRGFSLEQFVDMVQGEHEYAQPFEGMRSELPEARRSLEQDKPIRWKEVFDDLMYSLNYHAQWMPAEDHHRFHHVVMPFLMNVIAALPIASARLLLALYDAGRIELIRGRV